ncbi:dTMP kinase [Roseiconus nitratireducens]|uniref:Thymidylate kinase n=1 Tax=Roseiconus nitratireducens TaxID=2605748 RepID=A0A5M6D7A3_9BACT|nr:dTMP kinase [Roseiconus nitratireducens]KAA5543263.1 dTMP kinase [Roseiconus nitratireducens]
MSPSSDAVFISVDGIDGVGKSTQIAALTDWLTAAGYAPVLTRDPGSSQIGLKLRSLLLDGRLQMHRRTEAMLFMASRCEMVETTIRPALAEGHCVISDRFLLANVVYQSIASDGSGVPPDLLWQLGDLANGGLRPDLTLLLDMPAAESLRRIDRPADRMESRGIEYMEAVRQAFLQQLPRASDATAVIAAEQPVERVTQAVREAVQSFLQQKRPR